MIIDMITWWYSQGMYHQLELITKRVSSVAQTFSIALLLETLFAPFRQIDAGAVRGPVNIQFRAWADRTFSRVFGFFVRLFTILAGLIGIALVLIFGVFWVALWILLPVLPAIGLLLAIAGYTP